VVLLAVPLLIAGYLAVTVAQVVLDGRSRALPPVDAVVVMGAAQYDGRPSAQLAARLDHVVTLWEMGGLRSRLIAEEAGFTDVTVSTTPTSVVSGWTAVRRHLVESAGVALGRLVGFERLSGRG
jgi:hypothetical protein